MRTTLRALLALSLLVGFYLLVFAIVAIDLAALIELVMLPSSPGVSRVLGVPANAFQPVVFSVPLLIAVFSGVFRVSGRAALVAWSVPVSSGQAPELWAAVEALAGQVGTPAPTEIRLISEPNAMVVEESFLLGPVPGRHRLLYIGAPLLAGMTADELRAVLCHELGHYASKHTRLAALAPDGADSLPWRQWLELVAQARATGPARMLRRAVARISASDRRPLAGLLDLLEAGQARQIAAELSGSVRSPALLGAARSAERAAEDDGEALLLAGMFGLVGQALVAIKVASWQLSLDGECRLVARDITSQQLAELLAAAVARPCDVPRLRLHLAALGVNVTAPLALGDTGQAPSATARPAAQTARPQQRRYLTQTVTVTLILVAVLAGIGLASSKQAARLGATPQEPSLPTPPGYQVAPWITPGIGSLPVPFPASRRTRGYCRRSRCRSGTSPSSSSPATR